MEVGSVSDSATPGFAARHKHMHCMSGIHVGANGYGYTKAVPIGGGHCRIETSHISTLMTRMKGSKAPLPFVLSEHVY